MCRPARWLPGLIPLFLLFLGAIGLKVPEIRNDLTNRAGAVVARYGLGAPTVSGRDVTLNGANFSDEARTGAAASADAVDGVRLVVDRTRLVPVARPYALSATRDGNALVLEGSAPNPEVKAALVAAARQIAPDVDDRTAFARGAAPGFEGWARAALAPLARLTKGSAELSDGALSIAGDAPDQAAYAAALAATKSLPSGLTLAKADIRPPVMSPYLWSATTDGAGVTMEGAVPSEQARAALLAAARAALPGKAVTDRLQIARGAAEGFAGWTQAGLAALSKLTRGKASLSDSALTIGGETADSAAYQAALAAVRSLPAGLRLAGADIAPPTISPFAWSARFDGKSMVLEGYVPSEEARAALLAAAKAAAPGVEIVDRLQIARGAPQNFLATASAALKALAGLGSGQVGLSDAALSIAGVTKGGETAESFASALARLLPAGVRLARNAVASPEQHPYLFQVRKGDDGAISVGGFAPSEALREAALAGARAAGARLSGAVSIATGLPKDIDFDAATKLGLAALAGLRKGEMILGEDGLVIRGEGDEAAVAKIRAALAAPPAGARIKLADLTAIAAGPPPQAAQAPPAVAAPPRRELNPAEQACQQKLVDQIKAKNIQFRTGSADIEKESEGLIEDLAKILKSCPGVKVEVGGHTDNTGDADGNKQLSKERAQSVLSALVAAGASADRLSAAGYGDEKPVATNETREGRAQNRRTEFVVQ
jgi:OOP family OmpA-OmpF porin